MKKIGFIITSTGWGGLELNVLRLINWLTRRNWEITLFTLKESRIYREASNNSVNICEINNHKKYFDFSEAYKFSKILKSQNIQKLIVCDNRDLDFVYWAKKFSSVNIKVIYHQQMQVGVNKKDVLHTMRFSAIDYWIAPLNILKEEVIQKTKVKPEKIKVIPLCIEVDKFIHRKYTKEEARTKLNINPTASLVGIIGRIDPLKGQLFLVKAIKEVLQSNSNVELLIVGEPTVNDERSATYFEEINSFIHTHQLSGKIHLRNFTKDLSMIYNAIDVFALASAGETFGMVTIEAMLSQLPIIGTNSVGTPEILNNGELGVLYKPGDISDFIAKLVWMFQNKETCEGMAKKAQEKAIKEYSHTRECELIEEIL